MEETIPSNFGDLLKRLRKQRHITQQKMADCIDVHRNTIGSWERGETLPDSKTLVMELAHQLQLDQHDTRRLLEASLTSLTPYWQVPSPRNPFFTGREDVLRQLHDALACEHAAVLSQSYALSGLGGIGKTQTAIEYAYRYANDYTAVFWINAETTETIIASMVTIAVLLDLPEKQQQEQEKVVGAVIRWLTNHCDWLLIFDNVEDPAQVKRFLPSARKGSFLFTSRRQALGLEAQMLDMKQMSLEEGVDFLLRRAGFLNQVSSSEGLSPKDIAFARQIVQEMDGLPLALDQAGAYIDATRCSFSDYLHLFQSSQHSLLDEREAHAHHPLSVVKTFSVAFEQLERVNPMAAELLTACAFLAPEAIPETFFTEGAVDLGAAFETMASDPLQFQSALKALLAYSLLQRNRNDQTVTIHRLVQSVLKGRLSNANRRSWAARMVRTMDHLFPVEETQIDYWQRGERLLPHAMACMLIGEQWSENEASSLSLMNHVGTYLANCARFVEAEALLQKALHLGEYSSLDAKPLLTAESLEDLACLYGQQGKYTLAKSLYEQSLHIREQTLGLEHSLVADSLNGLATIHWNLGKHEIAETLYKRALHIWEQTLNLEHPHVATCLHNLALVYFSWQRYEECEELYKRSLHIWEQASVSGNVYTGYSLHALAYLYCVQEQYEKAEPFYKRALHIFEQFLGPEHPQVAHPLNGLGDLYREQRKYKQAGLFYQRALTIRQHHFGLQHPDVADTLYSLTRYHQLQHHFTEALTCCQQALEIREKLLGIDHRKTKHARNRYAQVLEEMEKQKGTGHDVLLGTNL